MPPEDYVAQNSFFVPGLDSKPGLDVMLFLQNLLILTAIIFLFWLFSREADAWNANPITIFRPGGVLLTFLFFAALWVVGKIINQLLEGHSKLKDILKYALVVVAVLFMLALYVYPQPFNAYFDSAGIHQTIQRMEPVRLIYGQQVQYAGGNISPANNSNNSDISSIEIAQKIHLLVNAERTKIGLAPLKYDAVLAGIAESHSRDMLQRNYFDHVSPEGRTFIYRYQVAGYDCEITHQNQLYTGGENLGQTYVYKSKYSSGLISDYRSMDEIAEQIVQGWMDSPTHRSNVLHDYWQNEGIGVAIQPDDKVYVTQNYC